MKKALISILLGLLLPAALKAAGVRFIQDNYAQALAQAKQQKVPLFVECWAPW